MSVRAALLDSGDVLIRPTNGAWFPHPAFREVLERERESWDPARLDAALEEGVAHLRHVHHIALQDEDGEADVWKTFYEILLRGVGARPALAARIVEALRAQVPVEPFPWTRPALEALRERGLRVVVVSNGWPSLRRHFRALDLERFLDGMVISAEVGITKPRPALYQLALSTAGCEAADAVFVDDRLPNVQAAAGLGMRAYQLLPYGAEAGAGGFETLTDLRQLADLL